MLVEANRVRLGLELEPRGAKRASLFERMLEQQPAMPAPDLRGQQPQVVEQRGRGARQQRVVHLFRHDAFTWCGNRLQQTLRFVDSATPTRKAKPAGVLGVEIWNKVGTTPPSGENDLRFVAVDTSAPYVMNFDAADGGKINYVWMRWVSPTGERGPWSEQAQASIAA